MRVLWLLLLAALAGCDGGEEEKEPVDTGPFDDDGDGVIDSEDCNDENAQVFPGALEFCNGGDDDCDGEIDENDAVDVGVWYQDQDQDDYGVIDVSTKSCDWPGEGWAD